MNATTVHRLDGLEPDNLLALLALLGLLRSLESGDRERDPADRFLPRAAWTIDDPPLRPLLHIANGADREQLTEAACRGIDRLSGAHEFGSEKNLNHPREYAREILRGAASSAAVHARDHVDALAALMTDGACKEEKGEPIIPTPLCLQFGQGHQHFLQRLSDVPKQQAPPARGRGKARITPSPQECLIEALFEPWHRTDPTFSFRWDPEEDVRYALMAGDPTDAAYKGGTQHGANRLAAVGLAALTAAPVLQDGRPRTAVTGGEFRRGFSFAWPIWREPASLAAIRAMLAHPALRSPGALTHIGVAHVFVARRISVGKFMNFSRGRPLAFAEVEDSPGTSSDGTEQIAVAE